MSVKVEQITTAPQTIEVDADFMARLQAYRQRRGKKRQRGAAKKKGKHPLGSGDMQKASDACFGGDE